ncbi:Vacuolar protein sorting-associated protein vps5 [Coemansia sp. RSA 552]|nr:Vacuolar protein sorting-associated protein vps5 [Coemansia sp. RSA 552]
MDDDLFAGGFAGGSRSAQPRPFSFADEDMNPFGDAGSPWGDAPPAAKPGSPESSDGRSSLPNHPVSDSDSDDDKADDSLADDVATRLRLGSEETSGEEKTERSDTETSTANVETEAGGAKACSPAPSHTATSHTAARRVGVIKRGLRSPRVLGKQLSPASFQDPLTSAAAGEDPLAASHPLTDGRGSVDERAARTGAQQLAAATRQTRSMSETRTVSRAQSPPHPYSQQLSRPQQFEQTTRHDQAPKQADQSPKRADQPRRQSEQMRPGQQRRRSLQAEGPGPESQMEIAVTDPVKVSDALKSHIAYRVQTQSDGSVLGETTVVVRRRYRDFDWLVRELAARHPGVIVPAIPEKQSMGRFEDEFVEARRAGLESSLRRIARHPVLWNDDALQLFLAADDFATRARAATEAREAAAGGAPATSSLFGDAWGAAGRLRERDEWATRRMHELDAMEEELRALLRALEYSQRQRRELAIAHGQLSEAYLQMAAQELGTGLATALTDMGALQQRLRGLQARHGAAAADAAGFQLTTDEYIRTIASVRAAFASRARAHSLWQGNLADLLKKRRVLEGHAAHPGRATPERIAQLRGDIARAEMRTEAARNAFDDVTLLLKQEMARFDGARVRDFQAAIEAHLAALIATQEEVVELWEGYLASNGAQAQAAPAQAL